MPDRLSRIAPGQSVGQTAKQSLMIASGELEILGYRGLYQLGQPAQRQSLLHTLNTEFDVTIPLADRGVFYPIVDLDQRLPVALPEADVVAFVLGYGLARGGIDAARRLTYRPDMLPLP